MNKIPKYKWNPLAIIAPVYYASKLFGILPISYANCEKIPYTNSVNFIGRRHENVRDGYFHVSISGLALWSFQFALQMWTFVRMCFYLGKTLVQRRQLECSRDNYCSVFGMLLSHSVISPIVVSLVLLRLSRSVRVLNMTARLLLRRRYPRHTLSLHTYAVLMFTLFIVFKLVTTVMSIPQRYPELYYPYFTAYMVPLVLINLISILCVVAQESYKDINRELEELCHVLRSKTERAIRLTELMNDHWFLDDYMDSMTDTFGPELLFIIMDIYVQFLLFLYVMIWDTVVRGVFKNSLYPYVSGIIELSIIIGKFIYLCYTCDSTVKESKLIIFHLKHLSSTVSNDLNSQTILRLFTLRVNSREIQVTASGFFDINLSLLFATFGVVLIYFLVLVQFQIEGHKKMLISNSSNADIAVICHSWPCLETS